ncbi:uncharacterized protein FIBRA_05102 [Fibroporia radiculosa]|uniref:Uncharacterized protein n=1 Tax=Fibroporia radiculosa TaxID=599839 RepID=J4HWY8_9APHY|nr:uncharacterized protein FIBRA_05102 [Fibroporia radiculosa]CCM02987.1 predicted protein [Fibroporia radiculosa]
MSLQYLPHVLYSLALTSISMHLLRQRKDAEAERAQLAAQISILDSTAHKMRAGEIIPERELNRLLKLAQSQRQLVEEAEPVQTDPIGWREVLLGRKASEVESAKAAEWDRRELESVQKEVQASS